METFIYQNQKIEYKIYRSKRKTVSIEVRENEVSVRVPLTMQKSTIHSLIETKADWILVKMSEMSKRAEFIPQHDYSTGDRFLFRGEYIQLILQSSKGSSTRIRKEGENLYLYTKDSSRETIRYALEEWYKRMARMKIEERVQYFCREYNITTDIGRIAIKDQKSRWGSCSSKQNLNFNYRLIMAPDQVLDYVVVHELCHLKHMNHSIDFWNEVARMMPDYQAMRDWLKRNGCMLVLPE